MRDSTLQASALASLDRAPGRGMSVPASSCLGNQVYHYVSHNAVDARSSAFFRQRVLEWLHEKAPACVRAELPWIPITATSIAPNLFDQ